MVGGLMAIEIAHGYCTQTFAVGRSSINIYIFICLYILKIMNLHWCLQFSQYCAFILTLPPSHIAPLLPKWKAGSCYYIVIDLLFLLYIASSPPLQNCDAAQAYLLVKALAATELPPCSVSTSTLCGASVVIFTTFRRPVWLE